MPGTVLLVHAANGDEVEEGDVLLVLESMKMELSIAAPHAGVVDGLELAAGRQRQAAPAARRRHRAGGGGDEQPRRAPRAARRPQGAPGARARRRRPARDRAPRRPRQAARSATASSASATPARRSSSSPPLAAEELYDGDAPGAGIVTGVGIVHGRRCVDRRQRRHRQGRHLLPDDGQEAPARAGGRPRQPPAVRLPRRLRRRVPAQAGRRLPRPRALRPDLLQPGARCPSARSRRSAP